MGLAALGSLIWAIVKGPKLFEAWRAKDAIAAERDEWKRLAEREREDRVAAEQARENWKESAIGAKFDLDAMDERIATLERRDKQRETLYAEREAIFAEVVAYTRDLLEWVVRAEQIASLGGVQLTPAPPVPSTLSSLLQMPRPPAAEIA